MNLKYLALGDSYTIGEGVASDHRWPIQLVRMLNDRGNTLESPEIVAKTGWTTDELLAEIDRKPIEGEFDLVSLLIGVNNQYRGGHVAVYDAEFRQLLARSIQFARNNARRVIVLSIPDWSVTPIAERRDRTQIRREIARLNEINRAACIESGVSYVDITASSRDAERKQSLLASDGLHPSAEMYRVWAELTIPVALAAIAQP